MDNDDQAKFIVVYRSGRGLNYERFDVYEDATRFINETNKKAVLIQCLLTPDDGLGPQLFVRVDDWT